MQQSIPLASLMPGDGVLAGWSPAGDAQSFDHETLFRYANGGAEFFFLYGFEQMVVRSYLHESGAEMDVEIWRLATPDDAYGLFAQSGVEPSIRMNNAPDAALDAGTMLCFWQDRYYVLLRTTKVVSDDSLIAFGEALSSVLPAGGSQPDLITLLPANLEAEKPIIFFREEMVIQDSLFLGGKNLLALSQKTRGVMARYPIGEQTVKVILVEYPEAAEAAQAGQALQASALKTLLASRVASRYLAAAFGEGSIADADTLLESLSLP